MPASRSAVCWAAAMAAPPSTSQTIALTTVIEGPPNGRIDLDDLEVQQEFWLGEGLRLERLDLRTERG